jgi:hypothetical protein
MKKRLIRVVLVSVGHLIAIPCIIEWIITGKNTGFILIDKGFYGE